MVSPDFEIIAGTYEEFLIGYHFIARQSKITQSFAVHDHSGSVRSLCISGHYLATGAADDRIIVYDLKTRKEHCMLTHHNASVTYLQFTNNHTHLLSGSSDGVLAIVRVGNWQVEKIWEKAHKGSAILDIAVHSSGKLALTLGADHTLRTWNLVKGRQAYAINLNSKCNDAKSLEKIIWAEDGIRFILSGGKYTEVWSIETGGILKVVEHGEKVCSCIWFSENQILVGYENGQIALVEISDVTMKIYQAHAGRVKVLVRHNDWVVSGSSTGEIKVWNRELQEVAKHDSGCRITCLGVVPLVKIKKEENLEDVQEQTVRQNTAVQKSSVIMEIEDDDESIVRDLQEVRNKSKDETVTIEVNEDETHESPKIKRKRKLKDVGPPKKKMKQRVEKKRIKKQKKEKKRQLDDDFVDDESELEPKVIRLKPAFIGCGRKRKEIVHPVISVDLPPKERRRKSEEPIKAKMIADGQPKSITSGEFMKHLEERRQHIKERKQMDALIREEQKQKAAGNVKLMGTYMGCGRKRKEIINNTVNRDGLPKKERKRKLEKPVKKDTSVNDGERLTLDELRRKIHIDARRMNKEWRRKQKLKKIASKKKKKDL